MLAMVIDGLDDQTHGLSSLSFPRLQAFAVVHFLHSSNYFVRRLKPPASCFSTHPCPPMTTHGAVLILQELHPVRIRRGWAPQRLLCAVLVPEAEVRVLFCSRRSRDLPPCGSAGHRHPEHLLSHRHKPVPSLRSLKRGL